MRRSWIACLLIAAAIALASGDEARAADQPGRLYANSPDAWRVSGTLDGVTPGNRTVRRLYVSGIGPGTAEGLRPLTQFKDLRDLDLHRVSGVDLAPLAEMHLELLSLRYVRDVDLAPLGAVRDLEWLTALDLRDVRVPATLTLPPSLSVLAVANDGWKESGAPVKAMVEAIDWTQLGGLRDLSLGVGGLEWLEPITVDLGFLRGLPRLTGLWIDTGVNHRGALHSPLTPPFDGLAAGLRHIRIDAWQPHRVRHGLQRRYPRASVSVSKRYRYEPGHGSWTLTPPTRDSPVWSTYGSFWEAADGRDGDTEYEALQAARRRLRRLAPALHARLEFDPESSGTGIYTTRRRDLVRALELLGIR